MDYNALSSIVKSIALCDRVRASTYVRIAASICYKAWTDYEATHHQSDNGEQLLQTFDRWANGQASNDELNNCYISLLAILPKDLTRQTNISHGLAGWTILDIVIVAIKECDDMLEHIIETALLYAAASMCGSGHALLALEPIVLNSCEEHFLNQWWDTCISHNMR